MILPVTILVVIVTVLRSPRLLATHWGNVIDQRQILVREVMQEDMSQKVVGLNPIGSNFFFVKSLLNSSRLVAEFVQ